MFSPQRPVTLRLIRSARRVVTLKPESVNLMRRLPVLRYLAETAARASRWEGRSRSKALTYVAMLVQKAFIADLRFVAEEGKRWCNSSSRGAKARRKCLRMESIDQVGGSASSTSGQVGTRSRRERRTRPTQ
jgi:hypothetical protein